MSIIFTIIQSNFPVADIKQLISILIVCIDERKIYYCSCKENILSLLCFWNQVMEVIRFSLYHFCTAKSADLKKTTKVLDKKINGRNSNKNDSKF